MIGVISGFQTCVKNVNPDVITNHCMIHCEALAARILPESLKEVMQVVIKVVNFIKSTILSSAVQTRLFRNLCADMDADHVNLLYYTEVR